MASPGQKYRMFGESLNGDQIRQLDEMLEDLYSYLTASPLGTSEADFDLSSLLDLSTADGQVLRRASGVVGFGAVDLTDSDAVSGALPVTKGGTGTSTQFTLGSVVFAGVNGVYTQDNTNLFWDDTNNRLGIGITPLAKLDVKVGTDQVMRARSTSSLVELYSANDANNAFVDLTLQNASLRLGAGSQFVGIGLSASPASRLHFKEETTANGGIRFGDDVWLYRSAAEVLSLTKSLVASNRVTANTFVIDPSNTGYLWWSGRALIKSPVDSQITLFNTAETTFDRINFGGTSSTDPALRREGSLLASKQADAADYTYFKAYEYFLTSGGYLMRSNANMTDGAAAAVGTLTNAPAAGNPTKWLKFDDNGTVRWIPAW